MHLFIHTGKDHKYINININIHNILEMRGHGLRLICQFNVGFQPISRSDLFEYSSLQGNHHFKNLEHAFNVAEEKLGIKKLLDPQGKEKVSYFQQLEL